MLFSVYTSLSALSIVRTYLLKAPADEPVYQFLDKKQAEGKPYFVYMTAAQNTFLRIYYARVKECLLAADAWESSEGYPSHNAARKDPRASLWISLSGQIVCWTTALTDSASNFETGILRKRGCPCSVRDTAASALVFSVPRPRFPFDVGAPK